MTLKQFLTICASFVSDIDTPLPVPLQYYKICDSAVVPSKAHSDMFEDAAWDLFMPSDALAVKLAPGERRLISTGLRILIPSGYWVKFHERSGMASKHGIQVMAGVIDNTYSGEWKVLLLNSSNSDIVITPKQAICQFTIEEVLPVEFLPINYEDFCKEEDQRTRGSKGFGSSDKK